MTQQYRYNTETKEFTEDQGNLGIYFYQTPWIEATQEQAEAYELQEAKDNTIAKILKNRNNWMYQPVTYKIDSKDTEFKATQIAGLNLIAAARSPRNMSTGTINWLDNNDNPILLTIAQAEGIIDLIEDQRSYSYFRQATLNKEIESCNSISEIEQIDISF